MNTQHKKILISLIAIFIVILLPMLVSAQGPSSEPFPGEPENAPIDGGLSLLVAAGVGYGAKKMKAKKAASNKN